MTISRSKIKVLTFLFSALLLIGFSVSAQESDNPLVPCTDDCHLCDFIVLGYRIYQYILYISFATAMLLITVGGILYITSVANPDWKNTGKKLITTAIIGFTILVFSWVIVNTILIFMGVRDANNWSTFTCGN